MDTPECSVCASPFNDPRVLPCGHTFCYGCLQQLKQLVCPLDRRAFGDVDSLARNYALTMSDRPTQFEYLPDIRSTILAAEPPQKPHILFVGNPGGGKSTLLNSLLRTVVFKSGFSVATGLTTVLQPYVTDTGVTYLDTPGLNDIKTRKKAAEEITEALKRDGSYMIFFVVLLDAGRVRPEDTTTMLLILSALEGVQGLQFSVIINKLTPFGATELREPDKFQTILGSINAGLPIHTDRVYLFPRDLTAEDAPNALIDLDDDFVKFIWETQPILIKTEQVQAIKSETFEELKKQMDEVTKALVNDKEKLQELLSMVQKESAQRELQFLQEKQEREEQLRKATEEREKIVASLNEMKEQIASDTSRVAQAEAQVTAQIEKREKQKQKSKAALQLQEAALKEQEEKARRIQAQYDQEQAERQRQQEKHDEETKRLQDQMNRERAAAEEATLQKAAQEAEMNQRAQWLQHQLQEAENAKKRQQQMWDDAEKDLQRQVAEGKMVAEEAARQKAAQDAKMKQEAMFLQSRIREAEMAQQKEAQQKARLRELWVEESERMQHQMAELERQKTAQETQMNLLNQRCNSRIQEAELAQQEESRMKFQYLETQRRVTAEKEFFQAELAKKNQELSGFHEEKRKREEELAKEEERVRLLKEAEQAKIVAAQKEDERRRNRPWRHPQQAV